MPGVTSGRPANAMKNLVCLAGFAIIVVTLMAQETKTNSAAPAAPAKLSSTVFAWEELAVTPTANGVRRAVLDGPTATLDKLHCHITTLNPGEVSGEPRLHLQEEVIIVKEGTIEAMFDGKKEIAPAGSVIFFNSRAVTQLRNTGKTPATYTVIYYLTPLTPKS
jgi:mannose-6-phosphate isomerase-like protein (cupin superfamily)